MPSLSERLGANITTVHHSSRVAKALASAGVAKTPELMRVVNLPRRKFDASTYPDASILYSKQRCSKPGCQYCKDGDPKLRPIQNAMIIEAAECSGGFFNVGVGQGKTLASFLMHSAIEATRTVLLVPAQLKHKTLATDLSELKLHFHLPPVYKADEFSGQSGVFVIAYEELSDTGSSDLLDKIKPDLIVADEAHKLRRSEAARTKRFLRFTRKNPVKFVAMTGSAMSRSILDFAHLIELALKKNSPLPSDYPSKVQWSDCIDKENTEIGALALLCEDNENAREGFQRRFTETPGVICTTDSAITIPIMINFIKYTPPAQVQAALAKLDEEWAWDNEEYNQGLEIQRLQRQLTQGFFYQAIWPNGAKDREWLEARNGWQRAIRTRLSHTNRVGQDSPALLEAMALRGEWTPPEWFAWLCVCDRPEPARVSKVFNHYLVLLAWDWKSKKSINGGIIWVDSPVIGNLLEESGIPYFGEGEDKQVEAIASIALENKRVRGHSPPTIALSMRAHGTGKNLQAWSNNLVLYPPASPDIWEQMIGRTHRPGQIDSQVSFDVILASQSAEKAMETAFEYAKKVEETTEQPQKLNLCQITNSTHL